MCLEMAASGKCIKILNLPFLLLVLFIKNILESWSNESPKRVLLLSLKLPYIVCIVQWSNAYMYFLRGAQHSYTLLPSLVATDEIYRFTLVLEVNEVFEMDQAGFVGDSWLERHLYVCYTGPESIESSLSLHAYI